MHSPRSAIKLRQLEYFLAVSKELHFSNAAKLLFVSQPTLSFQIGELEDRIGTPLFNRSGKTISLTEAGETLRVYVIRVLAELEAGRNALDELVGLERGKLRVGVSQSFVRKLLPPILGEFTARYPNVLLTLTEMTAGEIEKGLSNSDVDIGIAFAPAMLDETELEPLIEERLMLVTNSSHPLAGRDQVAMKELDGLRMAMLSRPYSTRSMIDRYLAQACAVPVITIETNSIAVMLAAVSSCDVAAIIPEGAILPSAEIAIMQLIDPAPMRISAILWSRQNFRSHAARELANLLRQRFTTLLPVPSQS